MHSDYSFNYVITLPIKNVVKLLMKSVERSEENKAWELYLTKYPQMNEKSYIPFDEFYNPNKHKDNKPVEEILSDVKELLEVNKGTWVA